MDSRSKSSSPTSSSGTSSFNNSISTSTRGVQKFYTKIRHKIEDLPPKISAKLHKAAGGGGITAGSGSEKPNTTNSVLGDGKFTSLQLVSGVSSSPSGSSGGNGLSKRAVQHGMLKHQRLATKSAQASQMPERRRAKVEHRKGPAPTPTPTPNALSSTNHEPLQFISTNPSGPMSGTYVDSDEECRLSLNISKVSLEDEIFEELEKVAHDEAKLNAVLKNFDKILSEYNPNDGIIEVPKKTHQVCSVQPPGKKPLPKKLQKSKTCSIIESRCILKKSFSDPLNTSLPLTRGDGASHVLQNAALLNTSAAGYQQMTKSLWNLKDFEEFSKTGRKFEKLDTSKLPVFMATPSPSQEKLNYQNISLEVASTPSAPGCNTSTPKKSISPPVVPRQIRSKSVWELSSSRSTSISKIPIMKTSSVKSLSSRSNSFCETSGPSSENFQRKTQLTKCNSSPPGTPQRRTPVASVRKIVKNLNDKSPMTPTKAAQQPRMTFSRASSSLSVSKITPIQPTHTSRPKRILASATSTPNSLNKIGTGATTQKYTGSTKMHVKDVAHHPVLKKTQSNLSLSSVGCPAAKRTIPYLKKQQSSDVLLDKCLEKGHEILRKVEAFGSVTKIDVNRKKVGVPGKRSPSGSISRGSSKYCNSPSIYSPKRTPTKRTSNDDNSTKKSKKLETPAAEIKPVFNYATEETVQQPPLESCKIIPPILGSTSDEHAELLVSVKQEIPIIPQKYSDPNKKSPAITSNSSLERSASYSSDDCIHIDPCLKMKNPTKKLKHQKHHSTASEQQLQIDSDSDDSGHISNENDDGLTVLTTSSSSSMSSASENGEDTVDCCAKTDPVVVTAATARVSKISELLEKFEKQTKQQKTPPPAQLKSQQQTPSAPSTAPTFPGQQPAAVTPKICTAIKIAEVEPIKCIQTHIEIFPTYSKEVIIRLL